ncbi:BnaCnng12940D [Brassica napus]|uniref:F-ATPase protein 6 n=1 Tax=Brassica napus TaxID=3708 RepID=A0A078I419_BRANA|nr:BnaCnng12940D [Brassica napus]
MNQIGLVAQSPLDQFEIVPLIPMNIGNFYFSFTNPSLFMLLTLRGNLVPNAWQSLVELLYDFVLNLLLPLPLSRYSYHAYQLLPLPLLDGRALSGLALVLSDKNSFWNAGAD